MARTSTTRKPAPLAKVAPEAEPVPAVNPRTAKSAEKLELACTMISEQLASGEWVSSNLIHKNLSGKISEGMFGRAKSALNIEHRRVKSEGAGRAEYEWRLTE